MIAEPDSANATCADLDDDGIAGFTGVQFVMRDTRKGLQVPASVIPDAEIDSRGWHPVTIVVGTTTLAGQAMLTSID